MTDNRPRPHRVDYDKVRQTNERIWTTDGPTLVTGWRHECCDWLAATVVRNGRGYTITHLPTGAHLLGDGGDVPLRPACEYAGDALALLVRLSEEEWLRDLEYPAGQEAADRLNTIVDAWRTQ